MTKSNSVVDFNDDELNDLFNDLMELSSFQSVMESGISMEEEYREQIKEFKMKWLRSVPANRISRVDTIIKRVRNQLNIELDKITNDLNYVKSENY